MVVAAISTRTIEQEPSVAMECLTEFNHEPLRLRRWSLALLWASWVFMTGAGQVAAAATPIAIYRWHEADSTSCRIFKWQSLAIDADLGPRCEAVLTRLSTYWFATAEPLNQRCDIVLHPTDDSYSRAVGARASQTTGSVLIGDNNRKPFFRIDVRASRSDWDTAILPHELTHVLFAQRFSGHKLPAWINEGTALLADPPSKQALHLRDCRRAVSDGTALNLSKLLTLTDYPDRREWPAFYGQSLSLVKCLVERESSQAFVEFVDTSLNQDCATGLREVYGIQTIDQLQQIWSQYESKYDPRLAQAIDVPRQRLLGKVKSRDQ
jgi:hypothetical protein